jgi:hypothetical protein
MKPLSHFTQYKHNDIFWFIVRYLDILKTTHKFSFADLEDIKEMVKSASIKGLLKELQDLGIICKRDGEWDLTDLGREVKTYLKERECQVNLALNNLRSLEEIAKDLAKKGIRYATKETKSGYFRSPLASEVEEVVKSICTAKKIAYLSNPPNVSRPIIRIPNRGVYPLMRQLDILIPGMENPRVVIEVKEFWGEKKGGSKMSNAVYETYCVARELKDLEETFGLKIYHYVVTDGKEQWSKRRSDLVKLIDLLNRGLIDGLFVGRSACSGLKEELEEVL